MAELSHWKDIVIVQLDKETGCIPWSFEWIIRYVGIQGIAFDTFQKDFDLGNRNSFGSVAQKVKENYPQIDIQSKSFNSSLEKVSFIRQLIEKDIPCLLSMPSDISLFPCGVRWHIVPVVYIDNLMMKVIWEANEKINHIREFPIEAIICWHNILKGGQDIAWIESPSHES